MEYRVYYRDPETMKWVFAGSHERAYQADIQARWVCSHFGFDTTVRKPGEDAP